MDPATPRSPSTKRTFEARKASQNGLTLGRLTHCSKMPWLVKPLWGELQG